MTYSNGRVLNYNYNSGIGDRISRLSSLSESTGTLESYSYLGLNTVIQRAQMYNGAAVTTLSYVISGGNPDGATSTPAWTALAGVSSSAGSIPTRVHSRAILSPPFVSRRTSAG
jgi:hypothetical protein